MPLTSLFRASTVALLLSGLSSTAWSFQAVSYEGHSIVQATIESQQQLDLLESRFQLIPLDCLVHTGPGRYVASPEALQAMTAAGINYAVELADVQPLIDAERNRVSAVAEAGNWYADFKDWDAINLQIDTLVAAHPDLATKITVGTSIEGRTIVAVRISGDDSLKPAVFFNGCQHAREWVAPMMPMYIIDRLLSDYDTDPDIQALVDAVEFFIVPVVNPDGYVHSWDFERFWRKNRRNNLDGTFGVDLNRNWGVAWNGGQSNSNNTNSDIYVGPSVMSEPEVQAIAAFIDARPQIVAHIDFHSYSQVILRNWGYTNELPPDIDEINSIGEAMRSAIFDVNGFDYPHGGGGELLYLASGVFPDWTYGEHGIFSWTVELRPDSPQAGGFELPPEQILPTVEENFAGIQTLAGWAEDRPALRIVLPDGVPGTVVAGTPAGIPVSVFDYFSGGVVPGSETLVSRINGGPFTSTPLSGVAANDYELLLPDAECGDIIEFYVQVDTVDAGEFTSPTAAPASLYSVEVIEENVQLSLDFEADPGWVVSGDAGDGQWEVGVPVGGGDRSDPATDFDGSGACYLTDNVDDNSDVDNGTTILTTEAFDISDGGRVSWAYWLNDETNPMGATDFFIVELATNAAGTNWQQIRDYLPDSNWRADFHDVAAEDGTSTMRFRFSIADLDGGSVIEGGLDAFKIAQVDCIDDVTCLADIAGNDGQVDVTDLVALITGWGTDDPDLDIAPPGGDGDVGVPDLVAIITAWGPCR